MASIRKRTWQTKGGEKSAWIVAYLHKGKQHIRTFKTKKAATEWRASSVIWHATLSSRSRAPMTPEYRRPFERGARLGTLERESDRNCVAVRADRCILAARNAPVHRVRPARAADADEARAR